VVGANATARRIARNSFNFDWLRDRSFTRKGKRGTGIELVVIFLIAAFASGLTFFSGFGLGTILLPVFSIFFPISIAVAATAIVHLSNNLFKFLITFKSANWKIVAKFGIPATVASIFGALTLASLEVSMVINSWTGFGLTGEITLIGIVIGLIIIIFSIFELFSSFKNLSIDAKWLPLGGILSGFFGGISGNQGALRSAFLIKTGISKEAFIATGVVIAVMVDVSRLSVYSTTFSNLSTLSLDTNSDLLIGAILGGIFGALIGKRLLPKVTFKWVQAIVAILLFLAGFSILVGVI